MNSSPNTAMFSLAQPPGANSAGPAELQPFVNPPSLSGSNPASLLGGQGGGLMGGADPLRAVVKPSEAMGIDPSAGSISRVAAVAVESDPLNGVDVRKDLHHLTRGHDP